MLSLLAAAVAVPLAPREKNVLPGPMIYSARDAPGPMIIDSSFSSVVPLATLDDDFVAKAEEATRAAAAAIKEQTDAIKVEEAKVKASEKAFAAADDQEKAGGPMSGVMPEDEGLVSEATQKMRDDEDLITKQRDAMQIAEQEARAAIASSPEGFVNEADAEYVAKEKASAAAAEATMKEDAAKIKAQTDAMEAGLPGVQAPAPSPYAVQAPAPDAVAVAPEAVGVQAPAPDPSLQAPAPDAVGVQAPAPVSVSPEAAAAAAIADADDADMDAQERQKKLEDAEDDAELAEEERRGEEIEKVQEEADKMEELQQEAEQEIEEEKEKTAKSAAKAVKKARQAKEKALEKRVLAGRSAKAARQKAAEKAGQELPKSTGKASRFSSSRKLSKMFLHGLPDDDLEKAGLAIHCFDDTENWGQKWMPSAMRRDQILGSCAHPPRVLKNSPIADLVGAECDYAFDEDHELKQATRMRTDRLKEMLAIEGVEVKESWKKEKLVTQYVKAKREKAKLELAEHRVTRRLDSASD